MRARPQGAPVDHTLGSVSRGGEPTLHPSPKKQFRLFLVLACVVWRGRAGTSPLADTGRHFWDQKLESCWTRVFFLRGRMGPALSRHLDTESLHSGPLSWKTDAGVLVACAKQWGNYERLVDSVLAATELEREQLLTEVGQAVQSLTSPALRLGLKKAFDEVEPHSRGKPCPTPWAVMQRTERGGASNLGPPPLPPHVSPGPHKPPPTNAFVFMQPPLQPL